MTMKSISLISFTRLWHLPPKDQKAAVLADWLKQTFQTGGKLYGRYSLDTKKPAVQYESPSVYALAILFFINQNEDKTVIKALYDRMNDFEILDSSETYYGDI